MRILFVHDYKQIDGGASQVLSDEIKLLNNQKHSVYFFTFSGPHCFSENSTFPLNKNNQITYQEPKDPSVSSFLQKYFSFRLYKTFKKTIEQIKPDIIHLHEVRKGAASIILAAKHSSIPIVQTLHDINLACMSDFGINRKTGKPCLKGSLLHCLKNNCVPFNKILRRAIPWKIKQLLDKHYVNQLICPSKFLFNTLTNLGYKNLQYLPNFSSLENNYSRIKKKNQILYIGRFVELKGITCLIKAFEIIVKKYPDYKLVLIGRGPEKERLQDYIKAHKIKNITLVDTVPHKKLSYYYQQSSVVVLPSIGIENCPLSIIEAMSFGVPVVASDIGGIPELVIDNITGMLFKPGDYIDLSFKILHLLSNPSILKKMNINCLNTIKSTYNEVSHYENLMRIYRLVLKSSDGH